MRLRYFAALACASLLFSLTAFAQVSINGSLRGRVSDPGNAALAGAALTLVNTATATAQKVVTDGNGEYQFARVAPGVYTLTIEKDGFKRAQREGLTINVNEAAVLNATLDVGGVTDTVTIKAEGQVVQSQTSSVSQLITEQRLQDLPLNSKDFQKLTFLAPGVGGHRRAAFRRAL